MVMDSEPVLISVVVPCYRCDSSLEELSRRVHETMAENNYSYELILVDDRSPADDWEVIQSLSEKRPEVKGIRLSRNFGQHYAITAGLDYASGEWCVVMDGDLQDQPEEMPKLLRKAQEGYDVVYGLRNERKDSFVVRLCSCIYHFLFRHISGMDMDSRHSSYSLCSRKVVQSVRKFAEKNRAYAYLLALSGYERTGVLVEHSQRPIGDSSYNFLSRLNLAMSHIVSHSIKPLVLVIQLGFLIAFVSVCAGIWHTIRYFFLDQPVSGWTSLIVSLYFLSGLLIAVVGVVGYYTGKVYEEVKGRPLYIVDETTFKTTE